MSKSKAMRAVMALALMLFTGGVKRAFAHPSAPLPQEQGQQLEAQDAEDRSEDLDDNEDDDDDVDEMEGANHDVDDHDVDNDRAEDEQGDDEEGVEGMSPSA